MALFTAPTSDLSKVNAAALLTAAGVATNYTDLPSAMNDANPTDTVLVRGVVASGFSVPYPCTVDATGANSGTAGVSLGAYPVGNAALSITLVGLTAGGRIVAIPQNSPTPNHFIFSGLNLNGAAHLEFFSRTLTSNGQVDTIELRNCTVRKTATHNTGYLGDPLFLFQARSDVPERAVTVIIGTGCDLQNDVGPIFGGYAAGGTTITLQGGCRLVPAPGRAIQEVYVMPGVPTFYANAQLIIDQRTTPLPLLAGTNVSFDTTTTPGSRIINAAAPARSLTFEYPLGGGLSITGMAVNSEAGSYGTATKKNVASAVYYVNGAVMALPLTIADGDTVRVDVTRTSTALGAYLILTA